MNGRQGLAAALLPAVFAVGVAAASAGSGEHHTAPTVQLRHVPGGDDNGDGRYDEDESGFDCGYDGNRVCGGTFRRWTVECANYYRTRDTYTRCVEIGVLNLERHNFSGWGPR